MGSAGYGIKVRLFKYFLPGGPGRGLSTRGERKWKNVMPMQPYLVLDTDDYEVKKEMKSGNLPLL